MALAEFFEHSSPEADEALSFIWKLHGSVPDDRWIAFLSKSAAGETRQWCFKPDQVAPALEFGTEKIDLAANVYVAPNFLFAPQRQADRVGRLQAVWADLDWHKEKRFAGLSEDAVLAEILVELDRQSIPRPSIVVASGRGHQLYWLLGQGGLTTKALPRWRAIGRELATRLNAFGADSSVVTPHQVMRLPGTINQKSGRRAEVVAESAERYSIDELAAAILPRERAVAQKINDGRRQKREAAAEGRATGLNLTSMSRPRAARDRSAGKLGGATYYLTILEDLERLENHRNSAGGRPGPGQRDLPAFFKTCALLYLEHPDIVESEIRRTQAWTYGGWSEREALNSMGAALRRARRSLETGQDTRYRLSVSDMIDRLAISESEMMEADLRILATKEFRAAARARRRRAKEGRVCRSAYVESLQPKSLPWQEQGVSRATYYRRRQKRRVPLSRALRGVRLLRARSTPAFVESIVAHALSATASPRGINPPLYSARTESHATPKIDIDQLAQELQIGGYVTGSASFTAELLRRVRLWAAFEREIDPLVLEELESRARIVSATAAGPP